jgi:hypothetical protein
MKLKKISPTTWIIIAANVWWSLIVALSTMIYFSSSYDNVEGSGFLLLFAGLPSSMMLYFFNVSVEMQIVLMAIFGYIQWNIIGLIAASIIKKIAKNNKKITLKKRSNAR